jgi:hypothetical protein
MAAQAHNACGCPETIIGIIGDVTEDNDRIAQIEIRPGMIVGEHLAVALRCWGQGCWCVAQGRPAHFTDVAHAKAAALRWVSTGRSHYV